MTYIPEALRRSVLQRANYCCEYCLLPDTDVLFAHEVDHIVAEKHRGKTDLDNLCYACFECNRHKGSDLSSLDVETNTIAPLYNPRQDRWSDHFHLNEAVIEPLTAVGRVTVYLLQINSKERVNTRRRLIRLGKYPCQNN